MGIILAKLWRVFWSGREHKVVIIGLDNAGKTTILYRCVNGETVQTSPTIGSNVEEMRWQNIRLIMWDLGGQEKLRASWTSYYAHAEVVVLVVDSTDRHRLPLVKEHLQKMLAHEDLAKAAVLVFANKQDVPGAMTAADVSGALELTRIKTHKWQIQHCSAITGVGIREGLEWMIESIR